MGLAALLTGAFMFAEVAGGIAAGSLRCSPTPDTC